MLYGRSEPGAWNPGNPRNKERTRESGPLLHHLFEGTDTRSLADWISRERSSHFGAGPDAIADTQFAVRLSEWWDRRRIEPT
jgi:hypothetical protein